MVVNNPENLSSSSSWRIPSPDPINIAEAALKKRGGSITQENKTLQQ